jgi:hypothetical protein
MKRIDRILISAVIALLAIIALELRPATYDYDMVNRSFIGYYDLVPGWEPVAFSDGAMTVRKRHSIFSIHDNGITPRAGNPPANGATR